MFGECQSTMCEVVWLFFAQEVFPGTVCGSSLCVVSWGASHTNAAAKGYQDFSDIRTESKAVDSTLQMACACS